LKEQLQLRDQIIKEKFGVSISNFLPNKDEAHKKETIDNNATTSTPIQQQNKNDPLSATFYKTATAIETQNV